MANSIITAIKRNLRGLLGEHDGNSETEGTRDVAEELDDCFTEIASYQVDAQVAAAASLSERPFFTAKRPITVKQVSYVQDTAITGDDTNNMVLTVKSRDTAGINPATVAAVTYDTTTGNKAAHQPTTLTLTGANVELETGEVLTIAKTENGTGMDLDPGTLTVHGTKR